ncbi:uncharacterized protein [Apostichopus japonicus]|uniref:uncharacterized protein n=1 Tax=Stichopus japonicus TaxID=307972 RepID=UPI003AB7386B
MEKSIRARRIGRNKTTLSWNERRLGLSGGRPLLHGPDKNSSAKEQQRRRDATKIYLLRSYVSWQMEKELYKHAHDLTSVSNVYFAGHLLQDHTKRCQMHLYRRMPKVKQRHSQQLSPQKNQLTLRKEKILLIQLLQHLSRSHLPCSVQCHQ